MDPLITVVVLSLALLGVICSAIIALWTLWGIVSTVVSSVAIWLFR